MELVNCTVAANMSLVNPQGGGLQSAAGVSEGPTLKNSIIAGNEGPTAANGPDIFGNVRSQDYNVVENPTGFGLAGPGDHNIIGQNPLLGPLADNGGDTQTHALSGNSPAVDRGTCTGIRGEQISADQRGVDRPQGVVCDIGAYELAQPTLSLAKTVDNSWPQPGQRITFTISVKNSGAADATGGVVSDALPVGLTLAGPVILEPPAAGVARTVPPLVTHLTVSSGQEVKASFPVTVSNDLPGGTVITNTAFITSAEGMTPAWGTRTIVVTLGMPERIYLPLLMGAHP